MGTQSVADTNSISKAVAEIQARAGTFSQPLRPNGRSLHFRFFTSRARQARGD